jgi:hypothetical protein
LPDKLDPFDEFLEPRGERLGGGVCSFLPLLRHLVQVEADYYLLQYVGHDSLALDRLK